MRPRRDADYMDVDSGSDISLPDGDYGAGRGSKGKGRSKAGERKRDRAKGKAKENQSYTWEASYARSWETVQEDEAGSLQTSVEELMARGRRRRLLAPSSAVRRTIIRHLILLLDLSASMMDRDMRPTRFDLMLQYAREFIVEWFDQNPLGQIGIVGMRAGLGEKIGDMSGNPQDVLKAISERHKLEPAGEPSLQNSIEMARSIMSHLPTHSSREILIIFGSLTTCDPGNIHDTLNACVKNKIRVSVVALAAEMKICRDFCDKTGGQFAVAINEGHFKDLLFELVPPPAQRALSRASGAGATNPAADLMMMGFPTRLPDASPPSLCVCHSEMKSEGFLCPRCQAKICDIPTDCDICGLMIVSSPHLARSYHHLFPVKPYEAVATLEDSASQPLGCHACSRPFPMSVLTNVSEGMSGIGRYKCPECRNEFCSDCDVFIHDVVHCCPGCGKFFSLNAQLLSAFIGRPPPHASAVLTRCAALQADIEQPNFDHRAESDRFVVGTKPVLIKGARIWTARKNGTEIIYGDILLDKGIIKRVGHVSSASLRAYSNSLVVVNANGAWVTPGLIDIQSHRGVLPSPRLDGVVDFNSLNGIAQPWLRTIDALKTHDDSYLMSIAGGITTALTLPGSANAIGGQGYVIKLRDTSERSPTSMLVEPPLQVNTSFPQVSSSWRYMAHACGENPGKAYNSTRMDSIWALRQAYAQARNIMHKQDEYCSRAMSGDWSDLGAFPESLEWEALVDVLRGRVKINVRCQEAVDLDDIVRLSREFQFPIAAIQSASEAYLVPEILKQAHGQQPAIGLAIGGRNKRETYRASEFSPRILAEHGFAILMQNSHPERLDTRYLLFEAQQAFFYGLPANLAIASVTSKPAEAMGMSHRIGYIKQDVAIWDSHPLALGASPSQVFIDGIPQFNPAHVVYKSDNFQKLPKVPNFDKEASEAVEYDGLPPLGLKRRSRTVMFTNVNSIYTASSTSVQQRSTVDHQGPFAVVVNENGDIICSGRHESCLTTVLSNDTEVIDLDGGSIAPGFVSTGSSLGLENIASEISTDDGVVFDSLLKPIPRIVGGDTSIVQAVDGLEFGTRDALLAYQAGVTSSITAPTHQGFTAGLSVHFSTSALHKMERDAVMKNVAALHVSIKHIPDSSISTQFAALRRLLLGSPKGTAGHWFQKVAEGELTLVVEANSADIIATAIILKKEVEIETKGSMKMTIMGAAEAHLLAPELAEAGVGVVLIPPRPSPISWERRRSLPGPPLTQEGAITVLLSHGVLLGVGVEEISSARNLRFALAWAAVEAGGRISKEQALAMGSVNILRLLGVQSEGTDLVVTRGGDLLEFGSQVIGVISPRRQMLHLIL
ncbi:hypothetical protein AX17_004458 [Amanita inopinata Kibby_2008]|nr:hypothetical protein AX17_004458 [Amanita inopinata Kibby_2008]